MKMSGRRAELRAVKDWRPIENSRPKPVKLVASDVRVSKNHRLWKYPYSTEVREGRGWYIASQHRTMSGALTDAKLITRKYKPASKVLLDR